MSVVRKILRTKIQLLEKLNKKDSCFYQIVFLTVARKNQLSLKIKNLIIFQMISLK